MKKFVLVLTSVVFLAACTTDPYTGERKVASTAKGAGIGAVAGAGIGLLTGKDAKSRRKNALIGAGIGTVAGGSVGGYMDYQANKLGQELRGTGVQIDRSGDTIKLVMPGNITFKTNSSDVNAAFYPTLNSVAKVLVEYKKTYVNVFGHTDSTGSLATNQKLSQERAAAVAGYLISRGVQKDRILIQGMGPSMPIESNATPDGREANRRVEITIEPITN